MFEDKFTLQTRKGKLIGEPHAVFEMALIFANTEPIEDNQDLWAIKAEFMAHDENTDWAAWPIEVRIN